MDRRQRRVDDAGRLVARAREEARGAEAELDELLCGAGWGWGMSCAMRTVSSRSWGFADGNRKRGT